MTLIDRNPWLPRFIVRYIAVMVTMLLIVSVIAVNKAGQERDATLRSASVAICQGQNVIRSALTLYFKGQVVIQRNVSYRRFFPDVPQARLRKARQKQIDALTSIAHRLRPLDCATTE